MNSLPAAQEMGRLLWRCRRGMKELDLLLGGYLRARWADAGPAERTAFERILELPDPLLTAYLLQRDAPADPDLQDLVAKLRVGGGGFLPEAAAAPATSRPAES